MVILLGTGGFLDLLRKERTDPKGEAMDTDTAVVPIRFTYLLVLQGVLLISGSRKAS